MGWHLSVQVLEAGTAPVDLRKHVGSPHIQTLYLQDYSLSTETIELRGGHFFRKCPEHLHNPPKLGRTVALGVGTSSPLQSGYRTYLSVNPDKLGGSSFSKQVLRVLCGSGHTCSQVRQSDGMAREPLTQPRGAAEPPVPAPGRREAARRGRPARSLRRPLQPLKLFWGSLVLVKLPVCRGLSSGANTYSTKPTLSIRL